MSYSTFNPDYENQAHGRAYRYPEKFGRPVDLPFSFAEFDWLLKLVRQTTEGRPTYTAKYLTAGILLRGCAYCNFDYVAYYRFAGTIGISLKEVPLYAEAGSLFGVDLGFDKKSRKANFHKITLKSIDGFSPKTFDPARDGVSKDIKLALLPPHGRAPKANLIMEAYLKASACVWTDPGTPPRYRKPFKDLDVECCEALLAHIRRMYKVRVLLANESTNFAVSIRTKKHPHKPRLNIIEDMLIEHIAARALKADQAGDEELALAWASLLPDA